MAKRTPKKRTRKGRRKGSGKYTEFLRLSISNEMSAKLVQRQVVMGERTISDVVRKILAKDLGAEP
jgi:hypothetical protein